MTAFDHERLEVFGLAMSFVETCQPVLRLIPSSRSHLGDQLDRASTSVVLNIAEGAGEFSPGDKARFYRMARRSASECAAILDVLERCRLVEEAHLREARQILRSFMGMLTVLCMRCESRAKAGRRRTSPSA